MSEGSAETRRCDSSRRVQEGQVYICRCGGRTAVEEEVGNSSNLVFQERVRSRELPGVGEFWRCFSGSSTNLLEADGGC